jgi:hypothetical protein
MVTPSAPDPEPGFGPEPEPGFGPRPIDPAPPSAIDRQPPFGLPVLAEVPELAGLLDDLRQVDRLLARVIDALLLCEQHAVAEAPTGVALEQWLATVGRRTRADRRMLFTATAVCRRLPSVHSAFIAGRISWSQLRTVALKVVDLPCALDDLIDGELAAAIDECADADPDALARIVTWTLASLDTSSSPARAVPHRSDASGTRRGHPRRGERPRHGYGGPGRGARWTRQRQRRRPCRRRARDAWWAGAHPAAAQRAGHAAHRPRPCPATDSPGGRSAPGRRRNRPPARRHPRRRPPADRHRPRPRRRGPTAPPQAAPLAERRCPRPARHLQRTRLHRACPLLRHRPRPTLAPHPREPVRGPHRHRQPRPRCVPLRTIPRNPRAGRSPRPPTEPAPGTTPGAA